MSKYDTTLDLAASNNSHYQVLDLVGGHKSVLDVGCATGFLASALVERGCVVSGIEYDADAAEQARPHLDTLVVGDLNVMDVVEELGDRRFDSIVLADVLEHLLDPDAVLARLTELLAPGGSVVISVPNVGHGSLRLALLQGTWDYRDLGLLDRTHIRFFTRSTLLAMVRSAGLTTVDVRTTVLDPLGAEIPVDPARLPAGVVDWVREQPDAHTYQFVVRAVRDDADGAVLAAAARNAELEERLAAREREVARLSEELADARGEVSRVHADVVALQSTRTMRTLAVPRSVYARVRALRDGGRTR